MRTTFGVKANGVDETAVGLKLAQQQAVDVVDIDPPRSEDAVVAAADHQMLRRRVVPGRVHEGRVRQNLPCGREELLHIPLPAKAGNGTKGVLLGRVHGLN